MPKRFSGKFIPNNEVASNHSQSANNDADGSSNGTHSTPQKYALLPEETEKLHTLGPGTATSTLNRDDTLTEPKNKGCCSKYSKALKILLPCRPSRKNKQKLPSNEAGLISYFSLTWLTKLMWKAYKQGLEPTDLWELQDEDTSAVSCSRLHRLWSQELANARRKDNSPQLWRAVWRTARTRIIVTIILSLFVNILQFLGPSVLLKLTLDYISDPVVDHVYGAMIVLAVFLVSVVRGAAFNLMFVLGTHTATRVTGAVQSLIYRKILKLKTGGEKLSAQITNILTNDMERLFESVISSVFLTVSPVLFLLSAVYSIFIIGPWALMGLTCYLLFYPIMGGIAKAQSRIRVKTVKKTDKRVGLMSEILNSLRLIKMYAWEDAFTGKISAIRQEELKRHRIGALLQATSSTTVPSISILATMCTLLGYTLTGLPLKSSEAFTIFSVFNALQFTVGVLPFTVRSIAEAKICLARVQKLLSLPEHKKQGCGLIGNNLALVIKGATFAWEIHSIDLKTKQPPSQGAENDPKKPKKRRKSSEQGVNGALLSAASESEVNEKGHTQRMTNSANSSPVSVTLSSHSPDGAEEKNADGDGVSPTSSSSPVRKVVSESGTVEVSETLFGINLSVERKRLVGVCGSVGAGKSSLISAICGDMQLCYGQLQVNGRLAVVTQQAWIYNSTLRENILVGLPFDEDRYWRVIEACSLQSDIDQLICGDLTEIGDRGINLSGGQKQRVNLARAVYSDRDIYLLDDPLSAVDTKVAKHLFSRCIKGALSDKTVILISHGTHFLEKCDEVILIKGGRICERGSHEALMERRAEYFDLVGFGAAHGDAISPDEPNVKVNTDAKRKEADAATNDELKRDGKLTKEEAKEVGGINRKVYLRFIKVCGGWFPISLIFLTIVIFTLCRIFNVLWLQIWLDAGDGLETERAQNITLYNETLPEDILKGDITLNPNLWIFQLVYGMSFIALIITGIVKGIGLTFRVLSGASKLHHDMFTSILRAPMKFLDSTPTGRILNRFSRDMDEVDVRIPFFMEFVLQGCLSVIGQIVMVCVIFPIFLAPLCIIVGLFIWIDLFLNAGVRELKRLDNTLKSPVIQHLNSSISGLSVIRTFDREKTFTERFNKFVDQHSAALLIFRLSNRWFTYRMDVMGVLVIIAITTICVFTKGQSTTAIAGLALGTINGVCSFIPFLMRMKSEFVSRMTSIERIIEYAYELESEAPRKIADADPPATWPAEGAIEFHEVKLRYRSDLPLVLHGITASIDSGEKIGIVGRTGAGKSSLISCLLRMVELESGWIKIDGVDVSTIGLHTLRSVISVIPQDPVLFQGSIRYNLDPFEEHSDEAVWKALECSHLKKTISKLPLKLLSEVEAAGENFSVGEKQLICLARALLRQSKVLLLDEATASVDNETDHLIQQTIQEAFVECTVLTIAHRLNTVASYSRILVLDAGLVKEFDSPSVLMQTEGSVFRDMMGAMGVHTIQQLNIHS